MKTMTKKEIVAKLRTRHPEAKDIRKNIFGSWDVIVETDIEEINYGYGLVNGKIVFLGTITSDL